MKGKDIVIELGNISQKYYEEAEKDTIPAGRNHKTLKRPFLIAAIIAMLLMLVGCAVVYALRLQDLKLGEFIHTYPRYIDANGEKVYATEVKRDVISLQGIAGSPEFLAAQEWDAYEWDIIANHPDQIINDFRAPAEYDGFLVGNQQMQDKIDEICARYNLCLPGPIALCQSFQQDNFFDSLGLSGLTQPNAAVMVDDGSGYFFANGNFKLEFGLTLIGEEAQWPHEILLSYNLKHKGYFDGVVATMEDVNEANQWNYSLSDGTEVLIVKSGGSARIFCDREDAFLSVGFSIIDKSGSSNAVMSDRDIELVAEALDFTVKPQKPDMEAAKAALEESLQKQLEEEAARMETWVNPFLRDYENYADVIAYMLKNSAHPEGIYYGLWDLTGDGEAELLIGCADSFGSAKTIADGEVTTLISNGTDSGYVLCNDRVFLYQNGDNYYFYRVDTINLENPDYCIDILEFDPWEEVWSRTKDGVTESITDEAAMAIIDGYGSINPGLRPITEYGESAQQMNQLNFIDPYVQASYRDYIEMLRINLDRKYTYGFADLNQDGTEELLIGYGDAVELGNCFTEALTIKNGKTSMYFGKSMPTYVCENNVLECVDTTRNNWRSYDFHDSETGEYGNHIYLNYNAADGVWLCGTYDKAWPEEITAEEAQSIIESHPRLQIEMKPISQYPMDE